MSSEVRQRKDTKPAATKVSLAEQAKKEDNSSISVLDLARGLVLVLLLSSAASYFVTGDSFVWNLKRPNWSRVDVIKAYLNGPKQYTDADLKAFDGSDPEKPILLAINGTIYDVSAGRKHYGPGGGYHFFAGADASRAFVTNCFDVDITPDMRGVETMFLPKDDPEIDSQYTSGQLKSLKEQERRKAKEEVHKALKHWADFFENSSKYTKVGRVKRELGWETKGPVPTLCESADARRKVRAAPAGK